MGTEGDGSRVARRQSLSRPLLIAGLVAFVAALLIHHQLRPLSMIRDVGIYPAVVFTGLVLWKPKPWFYALAAIAIAVPALGFVEWAALTNPTETTRFLNQFFLVLAGIFAIASGVSGLARR